MQGSIYPTRDTADLSDTSQLTILYILAVLYLLKHRGRGKLLKRSEISKGARKNSKDAEKLRARAKFILSKEPSYPVLLKRQQVFFLESESHCEAL
jgi:hypothetical protein